MSLHQSSQRGGLYSSSLPSTSTSANSNNTMAHPSPGGSRRESRIRIVREPEATTSFEATSSNGELVGADDDAWFPLHKAIFNGNGVRLRQLIEIDAISLLLAHKAAVRVKNNGGWSPLLEAVSYGDRPTVAALLRASKEEAHELLTVRKPYLYDMLNRLADFYLEVKWDFHTWIPLLSRILPSDTCKIFKRGCSLRMDTTLVDFTDRGVWERGDVSFIYNPHSSPTASPAKIAAAAENNGAIGHLVVLDNERGVYQRVRRAYKPTELEEDADMLMSNDIVTVQISTKPIQFVRAMSGWIFKQEKTADIGGLNADCYMVEGLRLVTKKRREHLTADDIRRNKAFVLEFASGRALRRTAKASSKLGEDDDNDNATLLAESDDGINGSIDEKNANSVEYNNGDKQRRSLPPPPRPTLTWADYVTSRVSPPQLGRPHVEKSQMKEFKAVVAMSEDFALPVSVLVDILEIVSTSKHIEKLRDFCSGRLPPGFPVKLEIPLLPTISAHVTFQRFEWRNDLTPQHFEIPKNYSEDAKRFHNL